MCCWPPKNGLTPSNPPRIDYPSPHRSPRRNTVVCFSGCCERYCDWCLPLSCSFKDGATMCDLGGGSAQHNRCGCFFSRSSNDGDYNATRGVSSQRNNRNYILYVHM